MKNSFFGPETTELVVEIKKPYPKLHFSQLFAFLTKKNFLAILRTLLTEQTRFRLQKAI